MASQIKLRKILLQTALGGLFGGTAASIPIFFIDLQTMGLDALALLTIGMIYLVIGVMCGLGGLAPNIGAHLLNVEDTEELLEQRTILLGSSASMMMIGCGLIAVIAADEGVISGLWAIAIFVASVIGSIIIYLVQRKHYDELLHALGTEAAATAFYMIGSVLLLWSAFAAFGFVVPITPFALIAMTVGGPMVSTFIVASRKGMMAPR